MGENRFLGNDSTRGPWSEDACHAGPPSGLMARAVERLVPDKQLVRLTLDFTRPIPMGGFRIEADIRKQGRMMASCTASLFDDESRICVSASSVHLAAMDVGEMPTSNMDEPDFEQAVAGAFPTKGVNHSKPTFAQAVEVAYPPGETDDPGPTTAWMRTPALLAGEEPSPFQRLCPLADCGNGISRNADITRASFLNPDLTIAIHRPPESQWLASRAISFWQASGLGLSQATLFDTQGVVGSAIQTLLVKPVA